MYSPNVPTVHNSMITTVCLYMCVCEDITLMLLFPSYLSCSSFKLLWRNKSREKRISSLLFLLDTAQGFFFFFSLSLSLLELLQTFIFFTPPSSWSYCLCYYKYISLRRLSLRPYTQFPIVFQGNAIKA